MPGVISTSTSSARDPRVIVVDNPERLQAAGMNHAIRRARGSRALLGEAAGPVGQARERREQALGGALAIQPDVRGKIVVMPELVLRGPRRALHNQRALYLKRLLLFEPRVILASVPYQLMR